MRIRQPRIQPATEADWSDDSRQILAANTARGPLLNVFATIARQAGLTDGEVERLTVGSAADGWSDGNRLLLQATEELVADHFVSDSTWAALAAIWSEQQIMDLVFAVAGSPAP